MRNFDRRIYNVSGVMAATWFVYLRMFEHQRLFGLGCLGGWAVCLCMTAGLFEAFVDNATEERCAGSQVSKSTKRVSLTVIPLLGA